MSLPAYPAYRDSGVAWLGQVPAHWEVMPLKRAARLCTDRAADRSFPVGLEHIESWTGRLIEAETEFEGDGVVFRPGDILFGKLRPYLAKAWLADRPGEAVGDFHVIRPLPPHVPEFLQRVLLSREAISLIDGSTYGSKMPRASWEFIGSLAVPFPPPAEQRAIAAFLDRECGKIDALVAEQERLIALLKEKRQAVISHAVTKGLDPTAPMKDSGVPWLGQVPAHWEVRRLRQVARLETGHTPSRQHPEYWIDSECVIPWFTLADVGYLHDERNTFIKTTSQRISPLGLQNSAARLLPRGSVILSRTASVGFSGIAGIPLAVSQDFVAWICGASLVPRFLLTCLRAMKLEFKRLMMGSTHQTIYMPDIEAFRVPVPPVPQQEAIAKFVEVETTKIDTLITEAERAITLLKERRAALISAAVTGKIDVRGLVAPAEAKAA